MERYTFPVLDNEFEVGDFLENLNDMVSKANEEALLSFYNKFSEKLSLEECKQLADVSYLLNTVVYFIESGGELKYQSYEHYGFTEAVQYLHIKWEGAEYFLHDLNAADDSFEISKILLILIYLARIECPSKLRELIPTKFIHREVLGNMLSYLDTEIDRLNNETEEEENSPYFENSNVFEQYSKLWGECLRRVSPRSASVSELEAGEPCPPTTARIQRWKSGTDIDVYIDSISTSSSLANNVRSESHCTKKLGVIRPLQCVGFRSSPIFESTTHPFMPSLTLGRRSGGMSRLARRSELLQSEKRIADLKSNLKEMGADYDALQEQCVQLSYQLDRSRDECKIIQDKFERLTGENEEICSELEAARNENLHLQNEMARLTGADGQTATIPVFAENEKLKRDKRRIDDLLQTISKELVETKSMLGKAERQLVEKVRTIQKMESEKKVLKTRVGELEELLLFEKDSHQRELEQKDNELTAKLISNAEVQDNYLRRINQLEYEMLVKKAEKDELLAELSRRSHETYWNALYESRFVTHGGAVILVVIGASVIWSMR